MASDLIPKKQPRGQEATATAARRTSEVPASGVGRTKEELPARAVSAHGRTSEADKKICEAWGHTFDTYRWAYLVRGPSRVANFLQLEDKQPRVSSDIEPGSIQNVAGDFSYHDPLPTSPPNWEAFLSKPLEALTKLLSEGEPNSALGKFVRLCAWQVWSNVNGARNIPDRCQVWLKELHHAALSPTILASTSDINSNLQIPNDGYPTYTLNLVANINFKRFSQPLQAETKEARERIARLVCPGPVIQEACSYNDVDRTASFTCLIPTRTEGGWESKQCEMTYAVDWSPSDTSLRLDFSRKTGPLLKQDRGYFLIRKKAGYVDATEIVAERSLWFHDSFYKMNATLMPLFRMMVESRVLRELSKVVHPELPTEENLRDRMREA